MLVRRTGMRLDLGDEPKRLLDGVVAQLPQRAVHSRPLDVDPHLDEPALGEPQPELGPLDDPPRQPRRQVVRHRQRTLPASLLVDAEPDTDRQRLEEGRRPPVPSATPAARRSRSLCRPARPGRRRGRPAPRPIPSQSQVGLIVSTCAAISRSSGRSLHPTSRLSAEPSTGWRSAGSPSSAQRATKWSTARCSSSENDVMATRSTNSRRARSVQSARSRAGSIDEAIADRLPLTKKMSNDTGSPIDRVEVLALGPDLPRHAYTARPAGAVHHEHPGEDHRRRRGPGPGPVRLRLVRRVRPRPAGDAPGSSPPG